MRKIYNMLNPDYNNDPDFLKKLPKKVIAYYTTNENNSARIIADKFNVAESRVHKIINQYLADTMRK